eukprot:4593630-Lingulodinium_polyedra.AAC.1
MGGAFSRHRHPRMSHPLAAVGRVKMHPFRRDMQEGRAPQRSTGHCVSISSFGLVFGHCC